MEAFFILWLKSEEKHLNTQLQTVAEILLSHVQKTAHILFKQQLILIEKMCRVYSDKISKYSRLSCLHENVWNKSGRCHS